MTYVERLRDLSPALYMVGRALDGLPPQKSGDRTLDSFTFAGINALLCLLAGEIESQSEEQQDFALQEKDKTVYYEIDALRRKWLTERDKALEKYGID
jgi:hypothetical protein